MNKLAAPTHDPHSDLNIIAVDVEFEEFTFYLKSLYPKAWVRELPVSVNIDRFDVYYNEQNYLLRHEDKCYYYDEKRKFIMVYGEEVN